MNLHTKNLKRERNNPLSKPWIIILLQSQSNMYARKQDHLYITWDIYLWSMYYNNSSAVHRRSKHRWENCLFWQSIEHHHYRKPQCQFYEFHCFLKEKHMHGKNQLYSSVFFQDKFLDVNEQMLVVPEDYNFLHFTSKIVWLIVVQRILALCSELDRGADGNSGKLSHSPNFI